MAILDKELQELQYKNVQRRNLKKSVLAFILLISASVIQFTGMDLFYTGHNIWTVWIILFLFYGMSIAATILAILTLIKSIKLLKTGKDTKNYISLGFSGLVCLLVAFEIISQL